MLTENNVVTFITAIGGFITGYVIRPIIIVEYEKRRDSQIQSRRDKDELKEEIRDLLTEIRFFAMRLRDDNHPDIESWMKDFNRFGEELYKQSHTGDEVDEDLEELLAELSGMCSANRTVISDLSYRVVKYDGGRLDLPLESEYESVYVDDDKEMIDPKRVLNEMTNSISERTVEKVDEAISLLD